MKKKNKISKDELLTIKRGARREAEIEVGIGVNRKKQVFTDKKKKANKEQCRKPETD